MSGLPMQMTLVGSLASRRCSGRWCPCGAAPGAASGAPFPGLFATLRGEERFDADADSSGKNLARLTDDDLLDLTVTATEQLNDVDEYTGHGVVWSKGLPAAIGQPPKSIGELVDDAMDLLIGADPALRATLPRLYNKDNVDQRRLREQLERVG